MPRPFRLALAFLSLVLLQCGSLPVASNEPSRNVSPASTSSVPAASSGSASFPADALLPSTYALSTIAMPRPRPDTSVLEYHRDPGRSGLYVEPTFDLTSIHTLHRDLTFTGTFDGVVQAQPLYTPNGPNARGAIFVVTQSNTAIALDEASGKVIWQTSFGAPADQMNDACTSYGSLGVLGTPYLDMTRRTLYLDAVLAEDSDAPRSISTHLIHALSIDDGSERAGWPVDIAALASNGNVLDPTVQNQRGALAMIEGTLYVPYGSMGDCGAYHGWVVAVPVDDPSHPTAWATSGKAGGIWGMGGVVSDGDSTFVATGNGGGGDVWGGGEAVLRFPPGALSQPGDFFAPSNWSSLDANDMDLGASSPLVIDLPGATPSRLVMALGKDGFVYLLDRDKLGGLTVDDSGLLAKLQAVTYGIVSGAATYAIDGAAYVVMDAQAGGVGLGCPDGQSGDLVAVRIDPGAPPTLSVAWCASNLGHGSPMVTTTDGSSDPIVWATGASGSGLLRGYDGSTGAVVYGGGTAADALDPWKLHRFSTLIAIGGRLVVAEDGQVVVYAL